MSDIGQDLKDARIKQGFSIEDMTNRTMIPKKLLLALEEGQFGVFPGEVYFKGALRKYATELGLDPQEFIDRASGKGNQSATLPDEKAAATSEKPKKTVRENVKADTTHLPLLKEKRRTRFRFDRLLVSLLVILLLAGAVYLGVRYLEENGIRPPQTGGDPIINPPVDEQPKEPAPNDQEEPEPPAIRVERDTTTDSIRFILHNTEDIQAEMLFSAPCWVRVLVDEKEVFTGTLAAGQQKPVQAKGELRIRIGNPPAFAMTVHGQQVPLPAEKNAYWLTVITP